MSLFKYLESHGKSIANNQWFLTKPLFGFKKVFTYHKEKEAYVQEAFEDPNPLLPLIATDEPAIANLIIPAGSLICFSHSINQELLAVKKIRASQAICANIVRIEGHSYAQFAVAGRQRKKGDKPFYYLPSHNQNHISTKNAYNLCPQVYNSNKYYEKSRNRSLIVPQEHYDMSNDDCSSGIHFFADIDSALIYNSF